ncbi:ArnT family glycosyltransferase [Acidovorax carolinensis]|uniref:ArnT family glycosyltransferase n=1 Tax=Acidovorax carolinensis TaxID=553814 RepID=UPI000B349A30|nr:glycosyltransferase family 39 protein [Acidovorax carolinensis]ART49638.1 hypothetical protein CBP33_17195 [Acidovorax carolinensis]
MRKIEAWGLLVIMMAAAVLRFSAVLLFPHQPASDELAYLAMAESYIRGQGLVDSLGNFAFYNAGYPMFVLIPAAHIFGDLVVGARFANVILGVVAVALCYLIARAISLGVWGRLSAAAIYAVYLPAGVYSVYVVKESLLTFLILLLVYCIIKLSRHNRISYSLLAAVVVAGIALVGNAGLSLLASLIVGVCFSKAALMRRAGTLIGIGALSVIMLLPWIQRNQILVGAPVLNTNGGFNFYLGNNPNATGYFMSVADTPIGDEWQKMRAELGEFRASSALKEKAIEWIVENPAQFAGLAFKKAVYFWWPPLHDGDGSGGGVEKVVRLLWFIQFIILIAFAIVSIFVDWPSDKDKLLFWLMLFSYTGVHMLFYVIYRYREPIMPVAAICAAVSLDSLLSRYWKGYPGV